MKIRLLIFALFVCVQAQAGELARSVTRDQFQVGRWWLWTYSELNAQTHAWAPTFYERYTVTAVEGDQITIEMSSDDHWPSPKPAHHRIVMNFADCERAATVPGRRNFTVRFYTTSLGNGWQLVSNEHPDLVFTEKFNCQMALPREQMGFSSLEWSGHTAPTFGFRNRDSFYFLLEPGLSGVVASKLFEPRREYKFEFTSTGF